MASSQLKKRDPIVPIANTLTPWGLGVAIPWMHSIPGLFLSTFFIPQTL